jgi:hypothetical protein
MSKTNSAGWRLGCFEVIKMDYTKDVEDDAFDFISDIEADIKAAIINGEEDISEITCDETGYGEIRDAFHESVTDRAYSIEDAAFIIANCEDEETDTGIWEGLEMREAMQACAAYSYGNDVWQEITEQYESMIDEFEPSYLVVDEDDNTVKEFTEDGDAENWIESQPGGVRGLWVKEGRGNIDELWKEYEADNTVSEIETGGRDELFVLKRWVKLNAKAGEWGGYPLGSVYIDTRCGIGYSMPDVKDFYDQDRITRLQLPSMQGKYVDAVKERIAELEGIIGKPIKVTVELEGDSEREIIDELHEIAGKIQDGYETGAGWMYRDRRKGA